MFFYPAIWRSIHIHTKACLLLQHVLPICTCCLSFWNTPTWACWRKPKPLLLLLLSDVGDITVIKHYVQIRGAEQWSGSLLRNLHIMNTSSKKKLLNHGKLNTSMDTSDSKVNTTRHMTFLNTLCFKRKKKTFPNGFAWPLRAYSSHIILLSAP